MAQTKIKGSMIDTASPFAIGAINITGGTGLTAPAVDDEVPIYDLSATTNKKITLSDLFKVINVLTAETAVAMDDVIAIYDTSANTTDKMTIENLLKVVNVLTEDTAPVAGDFLMTYDTSASTVKKVNVNEFALTQAANTFTGVSVVTPSALTHNTSWDGTTIQHATATVNGSSFTIANPTSSTSGAVYMIYISYTTSHSVSWGANFKGVSSVSPTATAGARDIFCFRSNGTNLELVGYTLNAGA
jgi:hypothetical protein